MNKHRYSVRCVATLLSTLLVSCGGGGGGAQNSNPPPTNLPPVPQNVSANAGPSSDSIEITWTHANGATSHNIYWSDDGSIDLRTATKIPGATSPTIVAGLSPGTTYYFMVTSVNSSGESGPSAGAQALPGLLESVAIIEAVPGDSAVTIRWHPVSNADSYSLFWREESNVLTRSRIDDVVSPFTVSGLSNEVDYEFSVVAVGPGGDGTESQSVNAFPYTPPIGWSHQLPASGPSIGFGLDTHLRDASINDSGVAAVVWDSIRSMGGPSHSTITHNAMGVWSTPVQIDTEQASLASVAVTPDGEIFTAYSRSLATIWVRRYNAGTWSDPVRVDSDLVRVARVLPELAVDNQGNVFLAWLEAEPTNFGAGERTVQVWVRRLDVSTDTWSDPQLMGQSPRDIQSLHLKTNATGHAVATWLQDLDPFDPDQPQALKRRIAYAAYYDGSGWSSATVIGRNDLGEFDNTFELAVDINSLGTAVGLWKQSRSSDGNAYFEEVDSAQYDPSSGSWRTPDLVTTSSVGDHLNHISVAIDDAGQILASWSPNELNPSGPDHRVDGSVYDTGPASWQAPHAIYSTPVTVSIKAKVVKESTGANVAAWSVGQSRLLVRRAENGSSGWGETGVLGPHAFRNIVFKISTNGHAIVAVDASYVYDGELANGIFINLYTP